MKIHKIWIEGFKNIEKVSMELGTITTVVGLNNFGKTNLLKGIQFASLFLRADQDKRRAYMEDDNVVPLNKKNAGRDFTFGFMAEEKGTAFEYSFSFQWGIDGTQPCITAEELRIRNNVSGRFIKYISRDKDAVCYRANEDGRCQKTLKMPSRYMLSVECLLRYDVFYHDILKKIIQLKVDYNRLSDSRIEPGKTEQGAEENNFSLHTDDGSNILAVIENMRRIYPDKYELWENAVKMLVPGIEEFVFNVERENVPLGGVHLPYSAAVEKCRMSVKERNLTKRVDLFRLSTGIRRIFLLVLNIVLSPINGYAIIEFEELESSINPLMLQRLLMTISNICDECRVIITSHSPALVNFMPLDHIYIGAANADDLARFYRIKKSRQQALVENADEMGVGIGDFIFGMMMNDSGMGMTSLEEWVDTHVQ